MRKPKSGTKPPPSPMPRDKLDAALARVAADYAEFLASWSRGEVPPDPKAFAAHQAAARSALAHMAELAAMAGDDDAKADDARDDESDILAQMRAEIAKEGDA